MNNNFYALLTVEHGSIPTHLWPLDKAFCWSTHECDYVLMPEAHTHIHTHTADSEHTQARGYGQDKGFNATKKR